MKKIICTMLVLVMILATLAACGSSTQPTKETEKTATKETTTTQETTAIQEATQKPSGEKLKVGFSLVTVSFPFFARMHDQFMEEAEARGWEVTYVDGNLDAATQINGIQDLLNKGIDVLVYESWYNDALADIFVQCHDKGIPVFQIGRNEIPKGQEENILFATGTTSYTAGHLGGVWCAGYLKDKNIDSLNVVLMSAPNEIKFRTEGFVDGMTENGIKVNVLHEYDASTRELGMSSTEDALTAYPDLDLIFSGSAQGSLGAYDAIVATTRQDIMIMGFDGEDEEIQLIDKGTNYIATITQNPMGEATLAAEMVDKWLKGEKFDQTYEMPAGVYSAEGQITADQIIKK